MSLETWHRSMSRNLDTTFLMTQAATPAMVDAGWGRVVMMSSVTGPVMAIAGDMGTRARRPRWSGSPGRWPWTSP